jgi:hypothetical protein
MGRVQPVGDLSQQGERALGHQGPFELDQAFEVDALDILHDQVWGPVDFTEIVDGHDVRMLDPGGGRGLDPEALEVAVVPRELRRDELHRPWEVEREVDRTVDHAHAAARDLLLDPVATVEHRSRRQRLHGLPALHGSLIRDVAEPCKQEA